jgi:hypothetical protein
MRLALAAAALASSSAAQLYGMQLRPDGGTQFLSIDLATGSQTPLGVPLPTEQVLTELSAMDQTAGVYYVIGGTGHSINLLGFDTMGAVVANATVQAPFDGAGLGLAWAPDTGQLLAAGMVSPLAGWVVGSLDPASGAFSPLATLNNSARRYGPMAAGPVAYAALTGDFLFELGLEVAPYTLELVSVNVRDGTVKVWPGCGYPSTLAYDTGASASFYGYGMEKNTSFPLGFARTIVRLAPDASACAVIGRLQGHLILYAALTMLDPARRLVYGLAQPCVSPADPGCNGKSPGGFDLVGMDLDTGALATTVDSFCFGAGDARQPWCPWSMELLQSAA